MLNLKQNNTKLIILLSLTSSFPSYALDLQQFEAEQQNRQLERDKA